ncbi:MAG: hypothetical protein ACJ8FY_10740 [Gemmataceae bacterium]
MVQYNDGEEVVRYIWTHCRHLMSEFELRAGNAIIGREKASSAKRLNNPIFAKTLDEDWGLVLDPEVNKALADGPDIFRRRVCERLLSVKPWINRCPKCGKVARTPKAKQCFWCSFDWHEATSQQDNT